MKYLIAAVGAGLLLSATMVHPRDIHLHFPSFSGHTYDWHIFQGEKQITVCSGKIPPDGRVTLVMPETYRDYRGMTRWMLKKGGGLDMIYAGKGFSVECLSPRPGTDNIVYTGNPENDYLAGQHKRQKAVLEKLGALRHLLQVYAPDEALHHTALAEQTRLHRAFERIQADRAKSTLYAARFGEIVDCTRGVADRIYDTPADHAAYFDNFLTRTLDFNDLYTSGHWDQVLHRWLMMNIRSDRADEVFSRKLGAVLSRMDGDDVRAAFAATAVPLLVEKGKDGLLPAIAAQLQSRPLEGTDLPDSVKKMMASVKRLTGGKAPDLKFHAPVRTPTGVSNRDVIIDTCNLNAAHTILLFYQGDCPLCEDALTDLANRYLRLARQNVRVIAISADTTDKGFEKKLIYHQWPDVYCDFTGMDGKNFASYGVLGVPTLFLLDQEGVVLKKTALVDDVIKHIQKKKPAGR